MILLKKQSIKACLISLHTCEYYRAQLNIGHCKQFTMDKILQLTIFSWFCTDAFTLPPNENTNKHQSDKNGILL